MARKKEKRFDYWYRRMQEQIELLGRHNAAMKRERRLMHAAAYEMATCYVAMLNQDPNRLRDLIRSDERYASAKNPVDQYLDDTFEGAEMTSQQVKALIAAVSDDPPLSRKKYLDGVCPAAWVHANQKSRKLKSADNPPPVPSDELDEKTRLEELLAQNKDFRQELRSAKQYVRELERKVRELERAKETDVKTIANLKKKIRKIERMLAPLVA